MLFDYAISYVTTIKKHFVNETYKHRRHLTRLNDRLVAIQGICALLSANIETVSCLILECRSSMYAFVTNPDIETLLLLFASCGGVLP